MVHVGWVRVDATRNRRRILVAARELVATEGAGVTMEHLAERAGVAVGTLYRHFPTKADLVAAIVDQSVEAMAVMAAAAFERARAGGRAPHELESLFRQFADAFADDRAVKQAAASLGVTAHLDPFATAGDGAAARAARSVDALLDAARATGAIRADVTVADLLMLVLQLPDGAAAQRDRYVEIVLAGLRS